MEEVILEAAIRLFKQKGYDGTSVQDIASEAGTTKSMLNYYFRSKEKLFAQIFHSEFRKLFSSLISFIGSALPLKEKITKIVELDMERFMSMPDLPLFILTELNHNPEIVFKTIEEFSVKKLLKGLENQIELEFIQGKIKKIKAIDLIINIQSLTIYPFLAKPILTRILGYNDESFDAMLLKRKTEIVDLIWDSIKL